MLWGKTSSSVTGGERGQERRLEVEGARHTEGLLGVGALSWALAASAGLPGGSGLCAGLFILPVQPEPGRQGEA